jgi:hypothetical protein
MHKKFENQHKETNIIALSDPISNIYRPQLVLCLFTSTPNKAKLNSSLPDFLLPSPLKFIMFLHVSKNVITCRKKIRNAMQMLLLLTLRISTWYSSYCPLMLRPQRNGACVQNTRDWLWSWKTPLHSQSPQLLVMIHDLLQSLTLHHLSFYPPLQ